MASLRLVLLGVSVLGCADTGAHLTLSAPEGPRSAETFRVVLATPEQVPSINGQRIKPGDNGVHTVSYYLQRTVAGASETKLSAVDGYTVRIAPDSAVNDTQFIPFVLMYDGSDNIVGIGSYRTGDAKIPTPILVVRDEIDKYTLEIEAVKDIGDLDEVGAGQVDQVNCERDDGTSFVSGVVWRPHGGGEYRLLLPSDGTTDATGRELDLDCDNHVVKPDNSRPDCDDTRNWFHRDAEDTCDGYDTNCDGLQTVATTCTANTQCTTSGTPATSTGIQLCDDQANQPYDCQANAACACITGVNCHKCYVPWDHGTTQGTIQPCQPAIGSMRLYYDECTAAGPCTVEVLGAKNNWKVQIASSTSGSFSNRAENVTDLLAFKVSRPEGPGYEFMPTTNTGTLADVDLALISPTGTSYLGVQLKLGDPPEQSFSCPSAPTLDCF